MTILALETSSFTASVALLDGDRLTVRERGPEGAHSSDLLALIDEVLATAGRRLADLDGIAVGAGPGSFTGLRIAMATAKGIAFAIGRPMWAVSSLAALALDAAPLAAAGATLIPVIDARRGEVFAGSYRVLGEIVVACGEERVTSPAALAASIAALTGPVAVAGDALVMLAGALPAAVLLAAARATPSAASVARLARAGLAREGLRAAAPVYLRAAAAEEKLPAGPVVAPARPPDAS